MTDAKHTEEIWKIQGRIVIAGKYSIEHHCYGTANHDEIHANNLKIAAADEMLKALELVWDSCCSNAKSVPSKKALLAVHAAMLKAKGESS